MELTTKPPSRQVARREAFELGYKILTKLKPKWSRKKRRKAARQGWRYWSMEMLINAYNR